ncbi:MAG TPA: hypothetical protein V6D14_05430 [Coleofasciculaceae cyanobacterium]
MRSRFSYPQQGRSLLRRRVYTQWAVTLKRLGKDWVPAPDTYLYLYLL